MAERRNEGGPAYPVTLGGYTGMTLRDYFAGLAMQGMLANKNNTARSSYDIAIWSYDQADRMLQERERG